MQWHTIPTKQIDDVIIATTNIFLEINYQKLHHLSVTHVQAILHQ